MARPTPGDVWMVDLGMVAKVRPCLILSDYPASEELALILIVPHTTAVRGNGGNMFSRSHSSNLAFFIFSKSSLFPYHGSNAGSGR